MTPAVATRPELHVRGVRLALAFGAALVAQIVAGLVVALAGGVSEGRQLFDPLLDGLLALSDVVLAAATVWAAQPTGDVRAALGLVRPRSWWRALGLALVVLVVVAVASFLLEPILHGARSQGLKPERFPGGAEGWLGLALGVLAFCVAAPLAEELFFRGGLYACFRARCGVLGTPLLTGALFGAAHLEPRAFPQLFLFGIGLGLLYERSGSVLPGMLLHATNNSLSYALALHAR
jgi:membrane protease YdiL (CAAX protease family)